MIGSVFALWTPHRVQRSMYDLLEDPLLSWREPSGERGTTNLPGLLGRLGSGSLSDFPRVRPHQFHPWSMFLTQLAAIALHRSNLSDPPQTEASWRRVLLELTSGKKEPWCLVVDDLSAPAFLQPPVPEATTLGWNTSDAPDDIDILVTSKAHDVKSSLIPGTDLEAWIYALVTLQTSQGYPGRGYNGISRMNGGYGNRPRVGLSPTPHVCSRFRRDLAVLQEGWSALVARGFNDAGIALVWTEPWDGSSSLGMSELSPHFIEICWRVRCVALAKGLECRYTTTSSKRCLREISNGDVGDPWVPIERDKGAVSVGGRGFHYSLFRRLLFENDFVPSAAQVLRPDDPDPILLEAAALARGQGKTEGLHERSLVLNGPVRAALGRPDARAALGRRAAERVASTDTMYLRVLRPALASLGTMGGAIRDRFDSEVDAQFFPHLFETLTEDDESSRLAWEAALSRIALAQLEVAILNLRVPTAQRWRAVADARGLFSACLFKNFPDLRPEASASPSRSEEAST